MRHGIALPGLVAMLALAGCATTRTLPTSPLPEPRLAPATLGATISVAQRLRFETATAPDGATPGIDAQLEVDADSLRLAGIAMGQRVLTLQWDGHELASQRHPQLPPQVDPARVLRDIQYAYWPGDVLRRALPPGWSLDDGDDLRTLRHGQRTLLSIRYTAQPRWAGNAVLDNVAERYRLAIQSKVVDETTQ